MMSTQVHTVEIPLRYRDLNLAAHIDNVEALRLTDEARLEFLRFAHLELAGGSQRGLLATVPAGVSELVVGITADFRAEMMFDAYQPYLVSMWVSRVGGSSFELSAQMRVAPDREPALLSRTSLVLRDESSGEVWKLDERTREVLHQFLDAPLALHPRD